MFVFLIDKENSFVSIKMSDILEKFKICSEISDELKQKIKIFHILKDSDETNVLFVTNDDKVFSFGSNVFGKCGFGHNDRVETPELIPELCYKCIRKFISGDEFVLAVSHNYFVYGWGQNDFGQLGRGYEDGRDEYLRPELISSLENIIDISCGSYHSLGLTSDGNVYAWGNNWIGQVGCAKANRNRDNQIVSKPTQLKSLKKIKSVECFGSQSFAVTFEGLVYSWGWNKFYHLGHKLNEEIFEPKLIKKLSDVTDICCSRDNTYFLTSDGSVYFCGEVDKNSQKFQKSPKIIETDLRFKCLHSINFSDRHLSYSSDTKALALSKEFVYFLEFNRISKTKFKTFFEYYSNEYQITFDSIDLSFEQRFPNQFELGSGGFGTVFKAKDKILNIECAVKMIKLKANNDFKIELMKEVKLLSKCKDVYVVKYLGSWIEQDHFFIKMELCSDNLKNVLKEKQNCFQRKHFESMTITEYFISCQLSKEIVECVQYLHDFKPNPIIHRDLNPANILVNREPKNGRFLKLGDFGLATFGSDNTITHTRFVGTPKYQAPEVNDGTDGRAKYSTKADIYSLGKIFGDLFDFDINSPNRNVTFNEDLSKKWIKLEELIDEMMNSRYNRRPTCAQILEKSNTWEIFNYQLKYLYKSVNIQANLIDIELNNSNQINGEFPKLSKLEELIDEMLSSKNQRSSQILEVDSWIIDEDHVKQQVDLVVNYQNQFFHTFLTHKLNQRNHGSFKKELYREANEKIFDIYINNKFEKIIELSSGVFGTVFRVRDKTDQQIYALKIIKLTIDEKNSFLDFQKELKKWSKGSQKFVVKYFDTWIQNSILYIQMELLSDNLKNIIEEKPQCFGRKPSESISLMEYFISSQILKEIIECVQYLHDLKPNPIIHKDLNPENIFINKEPKNGRFLKLGDFGLTTIDTSKELVNTYNKWTQKYLAPEVIEEKDSRFQYTTKSDIFCLGHILCDIFDLDIKSSDTSVMNNEELRIKWTYLEKQLTGMLCHTPNDRPTCAELLATHKLWAINEIDSTYKRCEKYKQNINQLRKFKNQFFYNYLIEKVIHFNDKFEKLNALASGGFATVFKVRDRTDQKIYALKIISIDDKNSEIALMKEVNLLSKCSEQYVVKYYGSWFENNSLYIQLELCPDNLKNIIQQKQKCFGRKSMEAIGFTEYFISYQLLEEILECVQYLHEFKPNPIIHRDLKPANILVNTEPKNGRFLKLCDFGSSRDHISESVSYTTDIGTFGYMAPEVSQTSFERRRYNEKSDIYSLSKIAQELFDFDIYAFNQNNEVLTQKLLQLKELFTEMMNIMYDRRPTCTQILNKSISWRLDKDRALDQIDSVINYENQFFHTYLVYKLANIK